MISFYTEKIQELSKLLVRANIMSFGDSEHSLITGERKRKEIKIKKNIYQSLVTYQCLHNNVRVYAISIY